MRSDASPIDVSFVASLPSQDEPKSRGRATAVKKQSISFAPSSDQDSSNSIGMVVDAEDDSSESAVEKLESA